MIMGMKDGEVVEGQFPMDRTFYVHSDEVVCPHCGYPVDSGYLVESCLDSQDTDGLLTLACRSSECNRDFDVETTVTVKYSTRRPDY